MKRRPAQRPHLLVEELERRILYSADAAVLLGLNGAVQGAEVRVVEPLTAAQSVATDTASVQQSPAREIIFIDSRVPDAMTLADELMQQRGGERQFDIVLLDAHEDGIDQINRILADEHDLAAIHIISHGRDGAIQIGSTDLDAARLAVDAESVARWGQALGADGDLLLYGCDVAQEAAGQAFVQSLARLTGADVAASSDATGHESLGGDWDLEVASGTIDAGIAFSQTFRAQWIALLPITNLQATGDTNLQLGAPDANFGASTSLVVDRESGDLQRALFQFDLGSIPVGSTINSATLTLQATQFGGAMSVNVYELTQAWTEGTGNGTAGVASWNQREVGTNWSTAGGTFNATAVATLSPSGTGQHAWSITALVQAWVNGSKTNNGVMVASPDGGGNRTITYDSSEGTTVPLLVIDYTPTVGVPSISGLAGDSLRYTVGGGPIVIEQGGNASVTDSDSPNFDTGTLTVSFAAGSNAAEDVLAIRNQGTGAGQIGVSGANVSYGGTTIGTFAGGSAGAPLVVTLNANANPTNTAALIQNITFQDTNTSAPTLGTRTLRFVLNDGDGKTSVNVDTSVTLGPTSPSAALWVSSSTNATSSAGSGSLSWTDGQVVKFGDPNLALGSGTTGGTFSSVFNIDSFASSDANMTGLHQVSRSVVVGTGGGSFTLQAGDVLLAVDNNETLGGVAVTKNDIVLFRPTSPGNYSAGTFSILLQNPTTNAVADFALVEQSTVVGGTTLQAGNFLIAEPGRTDVYRFVPTATGAGMTAGTLTAKFITGANINIGQGIAGLELVQTPLTLGGVSLSAGQLLVALNGNDSTVGGNNLAVLRYDVFTLTLTGTGDGTTAGTAAKLFTGADVGMSAGGEEFDALALVGVNQAPVLSGANNLGTITEDPSSNPGTLVSALISGQVSDGDTGAMTGIAVNAVDNTNGSWQWSANGGATWNAFGSPGTATARLLIADGQTYVRFVPNANWNGTVSNGITFRAWDQTTGTAGLTANTTANGGSTAFSAASASSSITVSAVNDAPTATNLSAAETYTEDTALNLTDIVISDVDSASVTATLTLSNTAAGSLNTGTSGAVTSTYNAGTGVWTASGAIANVNALLAGLTFTPTANFNSNFTIATSISDGVAAPVTGSKAMTGTAVNDAPTATNLNAAESYTEDTALNLSDIVISDVDSASVTATLTLSNTSAGSLNTGTSGAVTSTYNAGTGVWSASGAIANVNALLAGLTFTPAANFNSAFSIATSVSDGVAAPVTGSKAVTGTAVNDAPSASNLSAAETYTEDTALNLTDIVISDVDSASVTATLTLSSAAAGSLNTGTSGAVTSTYNAGTGVWSASGAIANVNALLAGLTFTPTLNFNSNFTIATNVSDGSLSVSGTKSMTGTAVNDAPANTAPSGQYTPFNTALVFSAANGNQIGIADPDAAASPVQVTLMVGNGTLTLAGTAGLTITGGANGSATMTFTGSVASINTALNGLSYSATTNFRGLDTLQMATSDLGNTGAGGTLTDTDSIKLYAGALVVTNTSDTSNGSTASISALAANDGGDGISLREAITAANNTAGADTIHFNIAGTGVHTITPSSALPQITGQVTIDASTDDSFAANGNRPAIILEGTNAGAGTDGLVLTSTADGSIIRGLVIRDFGNDGIVIRAGSDNNVIAGNYIGRLTGSGTDAGAGTGNGDDGIDVRGSNNTIGGTLAADRNVISGNASTGILLEDAGASGNTVAGNTIGLTAAGNAVLGNGNDGVLIRNGASGNTIGGATPAHRNVISGNGDDGVQFTANSGSNDNNVVSGNYIGTDATGTIDLGNAGDGVDFDDTALNNQILNNLIAGNDSDGIDLAGAGTPTGTIIQGNLIGTTANGGSALGNSGHGIRIGTSGTAYNTTIGGTAGGQGNTIAFNAKDGVFVDVTSTSVAILGNSIYGNTDLGINLGAGGVTANDTGDGDTGANNLQNFPLLASANSNAAGTTIVGTINSNAGTTLRIEFFANRPSIADAPNGEGERYLGFITVNTDGSGNASVNTVLSNVWVNSGDRITATATNLTTNDTSEFAVNVTASSTGIIVVDTTSDSYDSGVASGSVTLSTLGNDRGADGRISLREAIFAANNTANVGTPDKIVFNIAGAGPHVINVASALPTIGQALIIDASTDDSFAANGNRPAIVLDGNDGNFAGLVIGATGDGSTIKGLVIRDFGSYGLHIAINSDGNTIVGNYIGALSTGGVSAGAGENNGDAGIYVRGSNNTIGGASPALRNVISGNTRGIFVLNASGNTIQGNFIGTDAAGTTLIGNFGEGIQLRGATNTQIGGTAANAGNVLAGAEWEGIWLWDGTTGTVVEGNFIGTDITGTLNLGNVASGINIGNFGPPSTGNRIGGTAAGAANLIAFNGRSGVEVDQNAAGPSTGNPILGNRFYANAGIAIDLDGIDADPSSAGVTANDAGDADVGGNNRQNFPVLTAAATTGAQVTFTGTLNSTANTQFRIEFFASTAQDGSGHGEGQRYLGFANVTTDGSGNATISATLTATVAAGEFISATATKSNAGFTVFTDTSEFAQNVIATATTAAPVVTATGSTLAYTENAAATAVDSGLTVSDADSTNLTGATVTISANYANGQDVLAFTNQLGITGSWNAATGVMTLTGTTSVANYQTALRAVTYVNTSDNPGTLTRTVSFVVNDGTASSTAATRDISVTAVNDAPSAAITPATYAATEQVALTLHGTGLSIADVDAGGAAVRATVSVTSGILTAAAGLTGVTVTGSGTASVTLDGTLTWINNLLAGNLSGTLDYTANSDTPAASATLTLTASDLGNTGTGGTLTGNDTATINITAVNDAPIITIASLTLNEGQTVTLSGANFGITDPDDASFTYTVSGISGGYFQLSSAAGTPITTFTTANLAGNLVQFVDDGNEVAPAFSVTVNDGDVDSNTLAATITYTPVNDSPVLAAIEGAALAYTESAVATAITGTVTLSDVDSATVAFAWVRITGNYVNGEDVLSFTSTASITGSWDASAGTLLLIGSDTVANYEAALRSVKYSNSSDSPGTAVRTVSFTANDGAVNSNTVTRNITVTTINDAPTATITPASYGATEQVALTLHGTGLSIADVDAGGAAVRATLSVTSGILTAAAGTTGVAVTGSGTASVTLDGTLIQINNLLAGSLSGTFTYTADSDTPAASATLTLTASDLGNTGSGGTLTGSDTATVNITAVNDAPVTTPVTLVAIAEDSGPRVITQAELLANATDVDGPGMTANGLAISSGLGSLVNNGDGTWTYTPVLNDDTGVSLSYTVTDGTTPVASTASLDITPVNDSPVTTPVTLVAIAEDSGPRVITQAELLANATDVDGPGMTATGLAISSGLGTLVNNGDGTWTYTPALNDDTAVSFSYTVTDGTTPVAGTATLDITPVNDAPVTTPVTLVAIVEDSGPRVITQAELLANATDVDGPGMTATGLAISSGLGSLVDNGDGTWTYTPALNDDTAVSFSYTVTDGTIPVAGIASLDITPVNDAPVTSLVTLTAIAEDSGPRMITQAQLLANATDVDGPGLTATGLAIASGSGTLVNNGDGTWTYTPVLNDDTGVSFSYTVTDGTIPVAGTASLDITPVNDAPVTSLVTLTAIAEDSGVRLITQAQLLANATDIDGPGLTATGLAIASGSGTLVDNGDGTWTYTPVLNDDTGVSFSYTVTDGSLGVAGTATLDITPVNDAPVTTPVTLTAIAEDSGPRVITQAELLTNATDIDGPGLTATGLAIASGSGTLVNNGDGTWTYTPALNDDTAVSFSYTVTDGTIPVAGTASLDITPVNDAPVTSLVTLTAIAEDSGVRLITQAELLTNATDVDGPGLTATGLAIASGSGTLIDNGDGTWTYTPVLNDDTGVSFSYSVTDGTIPVAGTASLDITPVNDAPVTSLVTLTAIAEDSGVRLITQAQLLANATDIDGPGLTATGLAIASGSGMLVDNGDGTWTYTPVLNDDTGVSFSYTVTDGSLGVAGSASLDITSVNDAPVTTPVTLTAIAEDSGPRVITQAELLANATDVDGPGLTATGLAISSGLGTLVDNGDGTWTYTPVLNDDTGVSFSYTVTDGTTPVAGTASLDITTVNDAPATSLVTLASIAEDSGPRIITQAELLANATDVDGPGMTATGLTISSGLGSLVDNGDGTWTYTPALNDDTAVSFSYTVTDGTTPVAGTASLDITPVNDAPVTSLVTLASITEDSGPRVITQAELLANATDVDGPGMTATGLAIASGSGTLVNNGDGTWTYTPVLNDDTAVSFSYTVTDGTTPVAGTASLDITPVNDAPVTSLVTLASITEDSGPRVITQAQLLANATDVDGPGLTATGLAISSGLGTLVNNGDGTWTYTPALDDDTAVSFSYTVTDGTIPVAGTASLDITPVNDAPVTSLVTLTAIAEDSGVRLITQAQLLANATNVDGPGLTATGLAISSGLGTLVDNGDGTWTYTPALNDDTAVSFSYTVTDGTIPVAGTASLDITPVNDAPVTSLVTLTAIAEDSGPRLITQAQLLANATDVDGPGLTATGLAIASGSGTLVNNGDGTWTYTPVLDDDTGVSFSYTVTDGTIPVAGTASLDITPVNDAPVTSLVTLTAIAEDSGVRLITQAQLLANATDIDGPGLTATGLAIASGSGTLVDNGDGTWTYTPALNDDTAVSFSYTVTDGTTPVAGTASLDITPVNDAPVTSLVTLTAIAEDSGVRLITQAELLTNATDVDGPGLTATGLAIASGSGTLIDNGNGTWTYTPVLDDDTGVSFSYTVTDGTTPVAGTASLDITPVNDAPVTTPVTLVAIAEDSGPRVITQAQLLANATDVDGPGLTATGLAIASGSGTLINNGDGTWTYTPALNDDTAVSFSYTVTDGSLNAAGSATLDITTVNDAPVTSLVTLASIAEDSGPRVISQAQLLANATDVDGPGLTATGLAISSGLGSLVDNGDGTWTYTPALNDDTAVSFSYTVTDGTIPVAGTASLDITPVNDTPVTSLATLTAIAEDSGVRLITQAQLLANATDIDGPGLTATGLAIASGSGTLVDNGDGTWTYTPVLNDDTGVSFSYTVTDGSLGVAGTATLDITPVNDSPVTTPVTLVAIAEDSGPRVITQAQLLTNATDVDGPGLTATGLAISSGLGSLVDNGDGTWTYTPALNDDTAVSFSYTVTDGTTPVAGTATLDITPVNDAPVTSFVTLTAIAEDSGVRLITQAQLLANATDVDGPGLTATGLAIASGSGTLVNNGDGTWTYTPVLNDDTGVSFSYTVTDGTTPVAGTASLDITPVNDSPVTTPVTLVAIAEDSGPRVITQAQLLANATDIDGPGLTATGLAIASGSGTLVNNGDGTWAYTPVLNDDTGVSFTYTVTDGSLGVAGTASLDITSVNDAPVTTPVTLTAIAEDSGPRVITQAQLLANATDVDGPSLTATGLAIASGSGTLVNNGDGTWTYTPVLNDDTDVSFSYTVTDGTTPVAGTASLDITPVNDSPVTTPVTLVAIAEDSGPRVITQAQLLANATDIDGPGLTATGLAIASGSGTLVNNGDGTWAYTPVLNDDTGVSFTYTVTDGSLGVAGTATLDITSVNDAPVTTPVTLTAIAEDSGPRVITQAQLLANATDVDGPSLTATGLAIASGSGTLVNNGDGTWTYTPVLNDDTDVSFSHTVTDGSLGVAGTANLDITPVNDSPVTTPVTLVAIAEDSGPRVITQAELLTNATDIDGPGLTATGLANSSGLGTLVNNGDGTWTYTPALNDDTGVSFSYTVTDGSLGVAGSASLDITSVNDAPVTSLVTLTAIAEDSGPRLITQAQLLANATDIDGPGMTATGLTISSGLGSLVNNGDGTWTYTPALNDDGSVSFSYAVTDGTTPVAGTATLDITPVNDAPVTSLVTLTAIAEDSGPRVITQAQLLANATDVDGPGMTATGLAIASGSGTLVNNGDGTWTYTPVLNDDTGVSFSYTVTDGSLGVAGTATLDITPVNDSPVTTPVTLVAIAEDSGPRVITQAQLLTNATDVDGPGLTATGLAISSGLGSLVDNGDGTWTYTPALNDDTAVSFSYTVTDGTTPVAGTATLDITPVNDAPVTSLVTLASITEDSGPRVITQAELLTNATDVDGPGLTATGLAIASGSGSLVNNGDGTWTYTPALNDDTAVSFSYTVTDGSLNAAGSATLDITPVNDAPVTSLVTLASITEDSGPRIITQAELLTNATDVDGPGLTATGLAIASGSGTLVNNGDGTWTYTPVLNDDTGVSFSYTVTDGSLGVAGTATLDITPVNDAPVTTPVTLTAIAEDSGPRVITQAELLANATDVDGPGMTATGLAIASGSGTLANNGDGTWTYTPALNDDSSASFSYTVTDGSLNAAGSATLDITTVNDAPVTTPVTLTAIAEDSGPRVITQAQLLTNATDIDGPGLTATGLAISSGLGTLVNNGDGTWTYTPALDDDTAVSFSYTVTDGTIPVAGTATLDITPVNDAPVTTPVTLVAIAEDSGPRVITQAQLLTNATDVDGPGLTATGLAISSGLGSLVNNGDGTWTYTPALDNDTAVSFSYTVTDGSLNAAGSATLDITPINDAPVTTPVTLTAIAEDSGPRVITQAQLLANATDIDGPGMTATGLAISSGLGSMVNNGDGTWTYTPALNDDTGVSFSYTVTDGTTPVAGTASLDITSINDAPATSLVTLTSIAEDSGPRVITQAQLLANATDVDGPGLTATGLAISSGLGTLVSNGDGTWTYTPALDDDTAVSFSYTVTDGTIPVAGTASLDITPVNDTPVTSLVTLTAIAEDSGPRVITQAELLTNATDVDGPGLTTTGLAISSGLGSLVNNGDGTWTYTPALNDDTAVSFSYTVTDGTTPVAGTATLDITPVNDAPVTSLVTLASITEDSGPRIITQAELLANATDVDGPGLTATGLAISSGLGSLVNNGDGTWTYTPALDDDTTVSFSYTVTDGTIPVAGTASLDITPVNDAPVTSLVTLTAIAEDSGVRLITQAQLLANATDIDGPGLTATGLAIASGSGTLANNGDGTWTYTPALNDDTGVSFSYTVTDGSLGVAGSASLDITPVDDAPVTSLVTLTAIAEDSGPRIITQAQLLANATDVDGPGLTATGLTISSGLGSLVNNGDGTWTYTPVLNDDTGVSFSYTVTDGSLGVAGTATLDITPVNDSPATTPVTLVAIAEDSGPRVITQAELLTNATDVDGPGLTATGLAIASGSGSLVNNGDGTWTYTPALNDDTAVSFSYTVTDGSLNAAGSATLDITPVNDAPVTSLVTLASITEDSGPRIITQAELLTNATDVDGPGLTATGLAIASGSGTLVNNGDGTWTYTPVLNDDTGVSFSYTVTDGSLGVAGTATLDITPVNDAPVTTPVTLTAIAEDSGPRVITQAELLANATDVDGPGMTATGLAIASGSGTLVNNGDGTWTYTPALDDDTAVSFSYTVTDGSLNAAGSATLDITPINDAPVTNPVTLTAIAEDSGPRLITQAQLLANATDIDGPDLTATGLAISSGLGSLVDNGNGTWTYTPALNDDTAVSFSYTVTDGTIPVAGSATLDITPVNDAPTVSTPIADQNATEDYTFSFVVPVNTFVDVDLGDTLMYSASGIPSWLMFNADTRTFSGTPLNGDVGTASITVRATDSSGAFVEFQFVVTVANTNDAPTGSVTISGTATQGQVLTATNTLADADGLGTITYTWKADATTVGTGGTYLLTESEVGNVISVVASYTDGHGTPEAVTSGATAEVAKVNEVPAAGVPAPAAPEYPGPQTPTPVISDTAEVPPGQVSATENSNVADELPSDQAVKSNASLGPSSALDLGSPTFSPLVEATPPLVLSQQSATRTPWVPPVKSPFDLDPGNAAEPYLMRIDFMPIIERQPDANNEWRVSRSDGATQGSAAGSADEAASSPVVVQATQAAGVALTVGTVLWALRAGGLLASLIGVLPAWRHVDLLAILPDEEDDREDGNLETDDQVRRDESAVKNLLEPTRAGDES